METMPLPDLPASFSRAATGIRRCSPCAGAAFFEGAAQVITKPGPCARRRGLSSVTEFLPGCAQGWDARGVGWREVGCASYAGWAAVPRLWSPLTWSSVALATLAVLISG